jgi:hypothetical protein
MRVLLFLLLPLTSIAAKTFQLEVMVYSKLDKMPLEGMEVTLFEEGVVIQKKISDDKGSANFLGLKGKKYGIQVIGDTLEFMPATSFVINKKKKDLERSVYLTPQQGYFKQHCEKVVDKYFESLGSLLPIDTAARCDTDSITDAAFPGGIDMMYFFISNYMNYPSESVESGEQGRVYIAFVVEPDGTISNVRNVRGVSLHL